MTLDEELIRIKDRIDFRVNELLCATSSGYDDSITGMNEVWDIVRKIMQQEIHNAQSNRPSV